MLKEIDRKDSAQLRAYLDSRTQEISDDVLLKVNAILRDVRSSGDAACRKYTKQFDGIDMNGQPVRLYQGDFARKEVVADSVTKTVQAFAQAGAEWAHLVDLDGAAAGHRVNGDLIAAAAGSVSIPAEVGGGIRTMEDIDWYLGHGCAGGRKENGGILWNTESRSR